MGSYKKAAMKIHIKRDIFLHFVFSVMTKKMIAISDGKQYNIDKEDSDNERKVLRKFPNARDALNSVKKSIGMFDDAQSAIREGRFRISLEQEVGQKGGTIVFDMDGTPEEIEEWTKIGIKQKVALQFYRWLMKVEVEKFD